MRKLINKYKGWQPSIYSLLLLLILPNLLFIIIGFVLDNDFWFLINTGKTILEKGFINIEPFTIHSGLSFIPQQWLTDIIFYLIYQKFDIRGMYFFVIICNFIVIYLSYKLCYLVSKSRKKSLIFTIIIDSILIFCKFLTTRPQTFDIIFFLLELLLLESYISQNNKKYLFAIPIISLLLINLHASMWLMMFVIMIPYFAEWLIKRIKKQVTFNIKPLIIVSIISLFLGFVNPYGIEAIKYLFNSYGVSKINSIIFEMMPLNIGNIFGIIIYGIIFFILYSFYYNKGNNKIRYFLLGMGMIFLALNHYKGLLELLVVMPLLLGYNFKNKQKEKEIKVYFYEKIVYIILIMTLGIFILTNTKLSDDVDIKEVADYLDKNSSHDIKLFTGYNKGGYMEYRGYKCYIDPRAEVFLKANNKKEDIFDEYFDLSNAEIKAKDFLNKYNFDYLLIDSTENNLYNELQDNPNYKEVYSNVDKKIYLYENLSKKKNN